jgi:hypothetical protein
MRLNSRQWFDVGRGFGAGVVAFIFSAAACYAASDSPTVEQLLKGGWQIAGYSQAGDNRSTFILFRRPDESYLVQCRVGYDVSRQPSTYSICYELR